MTKDNIIHTDKPADNFLERGDKDYLTVRLLFGCGNCFHGLAAYHAKQCLEKYIKAYTVQQGGSYKKTHNLNELREMAAQYNDYFNNKEVKDLLGKFDIYEEISRYGAEAFYDPTIYNDNNIEIRAVSNFGFEQINILDKLVYEIRNLLDFSKMQCPDSLKEILENKVGNYFVVTSRIPAKKILTLNNYYYKG